MIRTLFFKNPTLKEIVANSENIQIAKPNLQIYTYRFCLSGMDKNVVFLTCLVFHVQREACV